MLLDDRPRYRPGVGISWPRAPLLVGGALALGCAGMWPIGLARHFIFVPAMLTVILTPLTARLIAWAHCRNKFIAAGLGASVGLIAYLGFFALVGPRPLPWQETGRLDDGELRGLPEPVVESLFLLVFCAGLVLIVALPATFAWRRAGRAYCPALRQWLRRETALLPAGGTPAFCEALAAGRLREFVATERPSGPPALGCRLRLEYAPVRDASILEHPVYATLADVPSGRVVGGFGVPRVLVRQMLLTPGEVRELAPLFPELELILSSAADAPAAANPGTAQITLVPAPYCRRVRCGRFALKADLLDLLPLFIGSTGSTVAFIGAVVAIFAFGATAVGCLALAFGLGLFVAAVWIGPQSDGWLERRLRREIGGRPDRIVDPRDPESLFVSWHSRTRFSSPVEIWPADLMFLRVCPEERAILMEGDDRRYRFPAAAILECDPFSFNPPNFWMLRLLVRTDAGPREFLLRLGSGRPKYAPKAERLRAVQALRERIEALRSADGPPRQ